jgi:hypothetical protein
MQVKGPIIQRIKADNYWFGIRMKQISAVLEEDVERLEKRKFI